MEQHPELAADEDAVIELLYTEYVVREELGEDLSPEEWYARFPRWRDRLGRLLEFHRSLDEEPHRVADASSRSDGAAPASEASVLPSLGPFDLIEEIGRGGMGVVYRARHVALNRDVAVKLILAGGLAGPRERERLRFEAKAVAQLHHPNIVQVYEFVDQGDLSYIVLEYVKGCNLAEFQRQSDRRVGWSARLVETLARAIHHAHQRGIVHRDLTPSNVLIAADETPKISDFGLAKSLAQEGSISTTGSFLGTPRYMAPEQVAGRSREVGPPADVYALGAILYELLTGVVPFRGSTPLETMRMVLEGTPEAPTRIRRDVPTDLETICLKCLERDPTRRYASAEALAEDLRRFQAGEPIRARPISTMRRLAKWARRRPVESALAALFALAVVAILVAGVWWNAWLRHHGATLEAALKRERNYAAVARGARTRADQHAKIARRHWYGSQVTLAQQAWEAGHVELAQELLANERLEPGGTDLPGFEWSYLHRLCHREFSLLWGHTGAVYSLAVSTDGRTLASCDLLGNVLLHDIASGRARTANGTTVLSASRAALAAGGSVLPPGRGEFGAVTLREVTTGQEWASPRGTVGLVYLLGFARDRSSLIVWDRTHPREDESLRVSDLASDPDADRPAPVRSPRLAPEGSSLAYSPDGRWLAMVDHGGRLTLHDAATGRERSRLEGVEEPSPHLAFSHNGERVAAGLGDRGVATWETASGTGGGLKVFSDHDDTVTRVALSPDGTTLAALEGERDVVLRDIATGRKWPVRQAEAAGRVLVMEFAPDGRSLAIAGDGYRPRICDVATGSERARLSGDAGIIRDLAFTPDGQTLVLAGEDPRIRLWHIAPPVDRTSLAGHAAETWSLVFSPDGRTLASGSDDNTIVLWDVAARRKRATLRGHQATVSALAFSPDGRTLASAELARDVKLWDVEHGRELATLAGHVDRVRAVAFSPDGKTLASTGTDRTIRLWDVASRTCREVFRGPIDSVRALAFSPDGQVLASAGNGMEVRLHSPNGGPPLRSWRAPSKVSSLAFSPDGRRLALGGEDRTVTIWDVSTGRLLLTLRGNALRVLAVSFSPDGGTLVSAGEDRTIRLWDPDTGQERLILRGHHAQVNAVTFSSDGQMLASGSHDGAIRLWQAEAQNLAVD